MAPPAAPAVLKVLIQGAQDLEIASPGQRPYYVLSLSGQLVRSRAAEPGGAPARPVWGACHKFRLEGGGCGDVIAVAVKDDATGAVLGDAVIDLTRVLATGRDESAVQLRTPSGRTRGLLTFKLRARADPGGSAAAAAAASVPAAGAPSQPPSSLSPSPVSSSASGGGGGRGGGALIRGKAAGGPGPRQGGPPLQGVLFWARR